MHRESFRFTLQQGFDLIQEPLRGKLFQYATLEKKFQYDALSYRWTDPRLTDPDVIEIDNVLFPIGPNLHAALSHLRNTQVSRYLWIDQICINQADMEEKVQQISIMGDIYVGSGSTVIWLGAGDAQSDLAMQLFPILVKLIQYEEERSSTKSKDLAAKPADFSEWSGTLGIPIHKLFNRDWFGRLWTLQEAALSQRAEVWCGKYSFPFHLIEAFERGCNIDLFGHWSQALEAIGWRSRKVDPELPDRSMIAHTYTVSTLKAGSMSATRVLNSLRSLDCSEHQDRIFSVLRFLDAKIINEIIEAPVKSSETLYHLVALNILESGDLTHLGAAGLSQHRLTYRNHDADTSRPYLQLASWVPDWTYATRTPNYWALNEDHISKRGTSLYSAGGPKLVAEPSLEFIRDDGVLRIDVIPIGEISQLTSAFSRPHLPDNLDEPSKNVAFVTKATEEYRVYIASCVDLAMTCTARYDSDAARKACRDSLVGGLTSDIRRTTQTGVLVPASQDEVDAMFESFERQVWMMAEQTWAMQRMVTGEPLTMEDIGRIQALTVAAQSATANAQSHRQLFTAIAEMCQSRRFFITQNHRIGMAPGITQPGDLICIIPGCCAPFVIRLAGDNHHIIGECYVYGAMKGELMDQSDAALQTLEFA